MANLAEHARGHTFAVGLLLAAGLFVANVVVVPAYASPSSFEGTFAQLAPFALVAAASTPAILGGGIDVSIGPLTGLIGVVYVVALLPHGLGHPVVAVPLAVALGAGVGALNGVTAVVLRYPPVIATLATYFVLTGLAQKIAPTPRFAGANWTDHLTGSVGPVPVGALVTAVPLAAWALLRRGAFPRQLLAVGGNDAAAFTAGVNVTAIRVSAYALGGALAAVGAFALTGLTRDGDATIGAQYTLVALAAVVLGGTPLSGGRGGLFGSVVGAACLLLIQDLVTALQVSPLWPQVIYGAILLAAVVLSARLAPRPAGAST